MSVSSPAAERRRAKFQKALRIAIFCIVLVLAVLLALAILTRFAGGWGVPYFSRTTERGSPCTNTFTGFECEPLTLADVSFFGDVELPPGTTVVSSHYRSTHDYQLTAVLEVPASAAASTLTALQDSYGPCISGHPSPLSETGLTSVCVMANDQDVSVGGVPDSRVYVVATALRPDKTRVVDLSVRSR